MRVESYDPTDMSLLLSDTPSVDFGNVIRGNHNDEAIAIRPAATVETFVQLALFLEDNAGLDHTQFGKFMWPTPIQGITPGSDYMSDYFVEVEGISDFSQIAQYSDYGLVFNAASPEYAWMDAEVGRTETALGAAAVNFRFIFEYN